MSEYDFDQKEIYQLCLPLKIIVPQIDYWDLSDVNLYEVASTHNFCNIAFYINTNESKDRLECWCGNCGIKLYKYVKRYDLQDFVESAVKNKLKFDNYHVLNKYCENIVMQEAIGES